MAACARCLSSSLHAPWCDSVVGAAFMAAPAQGRDSHQCRMGLRVVGARMARPSREAAFVERAVVAEGRLYYRAPVAAVGARWLRAHSTRGLAGRCGHRPLRWNRGLVRCRGRGGRRRLAARDARPYGIAFGGGLQRIGCAARAAMKAAPTVKPEARRGVGADAFIGPNPPQAGPFEEGTLAAQAGGRLIAAPTAGSRLVAFTASAQVPKACYLLSIVESRQ